MDSYRVESAVDSFIATDVVKDNIEEVIELLEKKSNLYHVALFKGGSYKTSTIFKYVRAFR